MEESTPPDKNANSSRDAETPNQHTDAAADTTEKQSNSTVVEPRTPEKVPEVDTPQPKSLRKYRLLYEDMRARYNELKNHCEEQMVALEKTIAEKDATIEDLKNRVKKPVVIKMNNEDPFVPKPRKNGKGETESNGCEVSGCGNTNVDLTKCSMCGNRVCEDCSGMKVAKLRPIMNACNKVYFTCPNCDVLIRDTSDVNIIDTLKGKVDVLDEQLQSYERENSNLKEYRTKYQAETKDLRDKNKDQEMQIKMQGGVIKQLQSKEKQGDVAAPVTEIMDIDAKLEAFSANILSKVTELMENKIDAITAKGPTDPVHSNETVNPPAVTWSNVVSQPQDMKTVMRVARNDEKIEEGEKQRRANNIIIHGAEEIGETPDEIKTNDAGYIKDIFAKIGVEVKVVTIARLGTSREGKRPIKLIMKSKEDKEKVMNNLSRLKNTEKDFGKISLKDDYTSNEREQIRMLTNEAKKKSDENPDRAFKVRGDSKNGWRIMSFPKKQ